ncbi:MAG: hypothetical protein FWC00_01390 [Firmicutes bacterium]|nr:hypothetical protein [Bacillota bacterium]
MKVQFLNPFSVDNIAVSVVENDDSRNILLLDFGPSVASHLLRTDILTTSKKKQIVAFGSHIHSDHVGGAKQLENLCDILPDTKLSFLLPPESSRPSMSRQRSQMTSALNKRLSKITQISPDEVRDIFGLKNIDFEVARHNPVDNVHTTVLIMEMLGDKQRNKTFFAADNDDKDFLKDVLEDPTLFEVNQDVTFKSHGLGLHFTLKKLEKLASKLELTDEDKKRIIGMHFFNKKVARKMESKGYGSARERLYTCAQL